MDFFERAKAVLDQLTAPVYEDLPFLAYHSGSSLLRPTVSATNSHSYWAFIERMSTYESDCWIQHPLSAIVLAQLGFMCLHGTYVVCCTCRVIIDLGAWLSQPDFLREVAFRAHNKICVWRVHQSPDEYFIIPNSPMQVFKSLEIIWKDLLKMDSDLPVVTRDVWNKMGITQQLVETLLKHFGSACTEKETSALILAICGWIRESNVRMKCHFCCKEIGAWNCRTFEDENSVGNFVPRTKQSSVTELLYRVIKSKAEIRNDEISKTGQEKMEVADHEISQTQTKEHSEQTLPPIIRKPFPALLHRDAGDMKSRGMNCNRRFVQYVKGDSLNRVIKGRKMCVRSFQQVIRSHSEPANLAHKTGKYSREFSEMSLKGKTPPNSAKAETVAIPGERTLSGFVPQDLHHLENLGGGESNDGPRIMSVSGSAPYNVMEAVPSSAGPDGFPGNCKPAAGGASFSSVKHEVTAGVVRENMQPHSKSIKTCLYGSKVTSNDKIILVESKESENEEKIDANTEISATKNVGDEFSSENGGTVMSRNRRGSGTGEEKGSLGSGPQIVCVTGSHVGDLGIEKVGSNNKNCVAAMIASVNCESAVEDPKDFSPLDGTVKILNSVKGSDKQKNTAVSPNGMDLEKTEVNSPVESDVSRVIMKRTGGRGGTLPVINEKQVMINKEDTSEAEKSEFTVGRAPIDEARSAEPSGFKKFASTETAAPLCTTTHMETHQSSALKKKHEMADSLVSAAALLNNGDIQEKREWNGTTEHQPWYQESDVPLTVNTFSISKTEWDKWPDSILIKECSRDGEIKTGLFLQHNGKEEEEEEMEWEAVKYNEYVPSAEEDSKGEKQIFQNGGNLVLTKKSTAEAACSNGFTSDVEYKKNSLEDVQEVENNIEVYCSKQNAPRHSPGAVDFLSSDNHQNENEQEVDRENFLEMDVSSMGTDPQCSAPAVGSSCESHVDTRKADERKLDNDDGESTECEKECLRKNVGKRFLHPEADHRFWCLWRIEKGGKKGWECFLESVIEGYLLKREIYNEEKLIQMMLHTED